MVDSDPMILIIDNMKSMLYGLRIPMEGSVLKKVL